MIFKKDKIHCPFLFLLISHNIFVSFDNMDKAKEPKEENYVINRRTKNGVQQVGNSYERSGAYKKPSKKSTREWTIYCLFPLSRAGENVYQVRQSVRLLIRKY